MQLESKISNAGVLYVPAEIREAFGRRISWIPNSVAAIMFPSDVPLEDVKQSVDLLVKDLELRIKRARRPNKSDVRRRILVSNGQNPGGQLEVQ
jgi:hypothetical protein